MIRAVDGRREHHEKPAEISAHRRRTDSERRAGRSIDAAGGHHDPRAQSPRPFAPFRGGRGGGAAASAVKFNTWLPARPSGTTRTRPSKAGFSRRRGFTTRSIFMRRDCRLRRSSGGYGGRVRPWATASKRCWTPGATPGSRRTAPHAGLRPVVGPPVGSVARAQSRPSHRRQHASLVGH